MDILYENGPNGFMVSLLSFVVIFALIQILKNLFKIVLEQILVLSAH